jgi:hypothetical protein
MGARPHTHVADHLWRPGAGRAFSRPTQLPMRPPSFFVITMVAERGRLPAP